MFFDLLYFLFLLYGTPLLISILIQIVKTIMRECGELLCNIVKGHVSYVTFLEKKKKNNEKRACTM